jgi:uncharacterized OB-fold protein
MGLAAIELVEQPDLRYLSRVVGMAGKALYHGMRVELVWIEENGRRWPAFTAIERGEEGDGAHG